MTSDSGNGQIYRHFKLALCYRRDNSNLLVDGTSFCFVINANGVTLNSLPDSSAAADGCWVDFVIVLDAVTTDDAHMADNNDYHANITITVSDGGSHNDTYILPMTGYYNYQEPASQGSSSFQVTDYNALINIKQMNQYSTGNYGTQVGAVDFETRSFSSVDAGGSYVTSNLSASNCFSISISSDMNYGSNDFVLKKVSSSISSYNDYNSIPIRVFVKPVNTSGYALDYTIDSGSDDLIAFAKRNLVKDAGNSWGTIANFEYKGTVYVCLADNAGGKDYNALAQTLTAGEYDCDIYFFVITP